MRRTATLFALSLMLVGGLLLGFTGAFARTDPSAKSAPSSDELRGNEAEAVGTPTSPPTQSSPSPDSELHATVTGLDEITVTDVKTFITIATDAETNTPDGQFLVVDMDFTN